VGERKTVCLGGMGNPGGGNISRKKKEEDYTLEGTPQLKKRGGKNDRYSSTTKGRAQILYHSVTKT